MRSLARDPAGRPESMEILRRDLMAAVEAIRAVGSNVLPRMASSTSIINGRGVRDRRGRKTLIALAAGGAALGLLAFGFDRMVVRNAPAPENAVVRLTTAPGDSPTPAKVALARDPQHPANAGAAAPVSAPSPSTPAAAAPAPTGGIAAPASIGGSPAVLAAARAVAAATRAAAAPSGAPAAAAPLGSVAPAAAAKPPASAAIARNQPTTPSVAPARATTAAPVPPKRLASAGQMGPSRRRAGATPATSVAGRVGDDDRPGLRTPPVEAPSGIQAKQLLAKAELLFQEANFPSAAYTARQALSAGAGAPAEVLLGHIYRTIGELADAKQAYLRALRLAPKDRAATEGLRKTQLAIGDGAKADLSDKSAARSGTVR
jgi:hypothetical protein